MEFRRESIFLSAIRSFCKMLFAVCGLVVGFFLASTLYGILSADLDADAKTKITYLPDAQNKREMLPLNTPVILQIDISGVIGQPKGGVDTTGIQNILVESRMNLLKNDRVKGILLYMNTPGGTVVDSDNIYRMLIDYKERYKVPVYAFIDGLCASGGMYISCAADQIFAGPASITGSVGVILGPFFNMVEAMKKIGVSSETITAGLDKDMMSPFRPWKEDEDASLKATAGYFYQQFVNLVADSRPNMDKQRLIQEYGAKVFDPPKALEYGYVDHIGASRNSTLLALLEKAGLDPEKPYQVVTLEQKGGFASLFSEKSPLFTGRIEHTLYTGLPDIQDRAAYLYLPNG